MLRTSMFTIAALSLAVFAGPSLTQAAVHTESDSDQQNDTSGRSSDTDTVATLTLSKKGVEPAEPGDGVDCFYDFNRYRKECTAAKTEVH